MPRLGIYLPEDLAARVYELGEGVSPLIQRALRRELGDERVTKFERPPGARERLRDAARNLANEAQREYTGGYEAALARLPELPWDLLETWADDDFALIHNPSAWLESVRSREATEVAYGGPDPLFPWEPGVMNDLAEHDSEYDAYRPRSRTFRTGYSDALRDAHEAVTRGEVTGLEDEGGEAQEP